MVSTAVACSGVLQGQGDLQAADPKRGLKAFFTACDCPTRPLSQRSCSKRCLTASPAGDKRALSGGNHASQSNERGSVPFTNTAPLICTSDLGHFQGLLGSGFTAASLRPSLGVRKADRGALQHLNAV